MSQLLDDDPETPIPRATGTVPNGRRSTISPLTRPRPSSPPLPGSGLRPRAASELPPPAPPPQGALPPPPHQSMPNKHLNAIYSRPRVQSAGHSPSGSISRLEPLHEEGDKQAEHQTFQGVQHWNHHSIEEEARLQRTPSQAQRVANRSQNLPPLPVEGSMAAVRDIEQFQDLSPASSKFGSRPRGASTLSTRSELVGPPPLINDSTTMGTISQRRSKFSAPEANSADGAAQFPEALPLLTSKPKLQSVTTLNSLPTPYTRSRASSQPGQRPSMAGLPPPSFDSPGPSTALPHSTSVVLPRKASVSSKSNSSFPQITVVTGYLSPPLDVPTNQLVPPPPIPHNNLPTTPVSPLPPTAPSDPLRKPYHMMNLLRHTMISKTGGYITPRLHVPQEVWSQGGARLLNLPEKVRVVEVLCSSLEEVQHMSGGTFGGGNVSASLVPGIGKKEGEQWSIKLEEFSNVCDGVVANFGKKLGVGEGFMIKKASGVSEILPTGKNRVYIDCKLEVTSWGGKLTRQLDKFTNQKK